MANIKSRYKIWNPLTLEFDIYWWETGADAVLFGSSHKLTDDLYLNGNDIYLENGFLVDPLVKNSAVGQTALRIQAIASSTANPLTISVGGTSKAFIDVNGYLGGAGLISLSGENYGKYIPGGAAFSSEISRNLVDEYPALIVDLKNASSTGYIIDFKAAGTTKAYIEKTGKIISVDDIEGNQLRATISNGTAPLVVSSATKVTNLNADAVDGYHFNQGLTTTNSPTFAGLTLNGNLNIGNKKIYQSIVSGHESYISQDGQYVNFYIDGVNRIQIRGDGYIDALDNRISNVANPTQSGDAVNKGWVEALVAIGAHPASNGPAYAASTVNLVSFPTSLPFVIDSLNITADILAPSTSIRILIKNQSTASQNGVYTVANNSGVISWTKDTTDSGVGTLIFIENGGSQNDWIFYCNATNTWSQYSKVDTVVADEVTITKTGQTFSVKTGGILDAQIGATAAIAWSKIASQGADGYGDKDAWTLMSDVDGTSLLNHLTNLYASIRLARGTGSYNTNEPYNIRDNAKKLETLPQKNRGAVGYLMSFTNIASLSGSQTIDGVASGTDGKVIILVGQTTTSQNGVYTTAVGAWTKLSDAIPGSLYSATAGSVNAQKLYIYESSSIKTLLYDGASNFPGGLTILETIA